jgi:hypothetical protein
MGTAVTFRVFKISSQGEPAMESAKQFEEYAAECLGWAKTARTEKERDLFIQMAGTWTQAATIARGRDGSAASIPLLKPMSDHDDSGQNAEA